MTTRTAGPLAAVLTLLAVLAAGCAPPPRDPHHLVVWTLENLPERLAAIRSVAERFTQATGITVEMVGVDENQFTSWSPPRPRRASCRTSSARCRWPRSARWRPNELLDTAATGQASPPGARDLLGAGARAHPRRERAARGAQRRLGPAAALPQDLFAAAGLARAAHLRRGHRRGDEAEHGRRRRVRRGHHRRRRVHPADLRAPGAGQRLRAGRTTAARSRSTAPQCVDAVRLLRRPRSATTRWRARRTSTPRGPPTSPARPRW